jgi:hypothetical protein
MRDLDDIRNGIAGVIGLFALIVLTIAIFAPTEKDSKERFKVVDSYHGCDIIRYTDDTNRWHYLMDCKK